MPGMRSKTGAAASEGTMASSAARCSSRWITVFVFSGQHRASAAAGVCAGHGGVRSISTLGAERLWRGGNLARGGAGKALTLKGLSGEWRMALAYAKLGYAKGLFYSCDAG